MTRQKKKGRSAYAVYPLTTIRKVRRERGLQFADLAEIAHVDPHTIWAVETGQRSPNVRTALKIAGAIGLPVERLFDAGTGLATLAAQR